MTFSWSMSSLYPPEMTNESAPAFKVPAPSHCGPANGGSVHILVLKESRADRYVCHVTKYGIGCHIAHP